MRWVTGTGILGVVLAGSVAALVAAPPVGAGQEKLTREDKKVQEKVVKEKEAQEKQGQEKKERRELKVRVAPSFDFFMSGGPQLGIVLRDLDDAAARTHKVSGGDGVLVEDVQGGSAAEKAGIKSGDVIREYDGERVRSSRHLRRLVTESTAGRSVKIVVSRDGKDLPLTVTPVEAEPVVGSGAGWAVMRPDEGTLKRKVERDFEFDLERDLERRLEQLPERKPRAYAFRFDGPNRLELEEMLRDRMPHLQGELERSLPRRLPFMWGTPGGRLGLAVQDLTPQLAEHFGVKDGVLVNTVTPDTPAAAAGVKAGDIITTVNGKNVESASDLVEEIAKADAGADVSLGIVRDRKPLTLKAKLATRSRAVGTPT